jgi:hypothetical protein
VKQLRPGSGNNEGKRCRELHGPGLFPGNHCRAQGFESWALNWVEGAPAVKRILRPISYVLAAIYFCVDLIFVGLALPVSRWIGRHFEMRKLRALIGSLPPYPCLALFSVPVILLEPVKFLAAYMAATGKLVSAAIAFVVGELLKLVLIERLFDLTRAKLLKIPAFAWIYGHYARARAWILQSEAVQTIRSMSRSIFNAIKAWREAFTRRIAQNQGG